LTSAADMLYEHTTQIGRRTDSFKSEDGRRAAPNRPVRVGAPRGVKRAPGPAKGQRENLPASRCEEAGHPPPGVVSGSAFWASPVSRQAYGFGSLGNIGRIEKPWPGRIELGSWIRKSFQLKGLRIPGRCESLRIVANCCETLRILAFCCVPLRFIAFPCISSRSMSLRSAGGMLRAPSPGEPGIPGVPE
jgi:hypothetical protein